MIGLGECQSVAGSRDDRKQIELKLYIYGTATLCNAPRRIEVAHCRQTYGIGDPT
jgi:hypothetical protein